MKKTIIALIMGFCGTTLQGFSQEVYKMVLQSATRVVNNPTSNYATTSIAQFKRTALTYLRDKAFEKSDSVSAEFLDTQAYYLAEFTTKYITDITTLQGSALKNRVLQYTAATHEFPMWNDPDKETTESFIIAGELTPFSLDTDWEKAYSKISENTEKK